MHYAVAGRKNKPVATGLVATGQDAHKEPGYSQPGDVYFISGYFFSAGLSAAAGFFTAGRGVGLGVQKSPPVFAHSFGT